MVHCSPYESVIGDLRLDKCYDELDEKEFSRKPMPSDNIGWVLYTILAVAVTSVVGLIVVCGFGAIYIDKRKKYRENAYVNTRIGVVVYEDEDEVHRR